MEIQGLQILAQKFLHIYVVAGVPQVYQTHIQPCYELAFTATRSVSGYCCKLSNVELG